MHQTRNEVTTKLPIPRKGNKYVARALSHVNDSVPVVIALRDMLKVARTKKEVDEMIKLKSLKINWKPVRDCRESIKLFNVFEADKTYVLKILPSGKFFLEESKEKSLRLCKVISKKLNPGNKVQINLHDGSNLITKENISVGDSVYLDSSGKVKKHLKLEKGAEAFIISGKYSGQSCKVSKVDGKNISVSFKHKEAILPLKEVFVI